MKWQHSTERREKLRTMQLSENAELEPIELRRLDELPDDWRDWSARKLRDAVGENRTWDGTADPKPAKPKEPTIGDKAVALLRQTQQPMHYQEIARQLMENGLETDGATPDRTIAAALARQTGESVQRVAPGVYRAT